MRGLSPAAELADPVLVRRRNPFRNRKLFLRVPRGDGHRETPEHNPVSIRSRRRYEVAAMLRAAALLSFACLASSAVAEEGPRCASLEKAQNSAGKDTAIAPLTAAQFHFLQGVYVLNPTMPDGLPPGDGALLLTRDHGDDGLILWTLGPLVCEPMPAPKKLIDYLGQDHFEDPPIARGNIFGRVSAVVPLAAVAAVLAINWKWSAVAVPARS